VFSSSDVSVSNRNAEQDDKIVNKVRCANKGQGKETNDAIQEGTSLIARAGVIWTVLLGPERQMYATKSTTNALRYTLW
jgi:hypothetical protein